MIIGIPREIKPREYRVAQPPHGVRELVRHGHTVLVERGAGIGSGFDDEQYAAAGAQLVEDAATVWGEAELVIKVKEPIEPEFRYLRPELILFTFLHLAANEALTRVLLERGVTAIAYETVQLPDGSLPLLAPMSEVAGRLAVQVGAYYLMEPYGGRGVLLGGVPGVSPGKVVIIGGGRSERMLPRWRWGSARMWSYSTSTSSGSVISNRSFTAGSAPKCRTSKHSARRSGRPIWSSEQS